MCKKSHLKHPGLAEDLICNVEIRSLNPTRYLIYFTNPSGKHARKIYCGFKYSRWDQGGYSWTSCVHLTFVNKKNNNKTAWRWIQTDEKKGLSFFKSLRKRTALDNNEATCGQPPAPSKKGKPKEWEIKPAAFCFVSRVYNPCRLSSMSGDERAFIDPLLWSSACVQVFHFRRVEHLTVKSRARVLAALVGGGIVTL